MKSRRSLNEEQNLAVQHGDGPAVILAGAGSGKTAVMTARVEELIRRGVKPTRILVITFTNRAAGELLERLGFDENEPHPRVGTIHSLALSMIRKDPLGFGLYERVTPMDDCDQKILLQSIIDRYKMDELKSYILKDKLQFHRARGVGFRVDYTPAVHERALCSYSGTQALNDDELVIWEAYEKEKAKQGLVDFDDMLHLVVKRGREDDKWAHKVKKQFDQILMDEAQDTNQVQWDLVNLLFAEDNFNAFVVGDLSQSIYGFAGAAPDILYQFTNEWRGHKPAMFKLVRNHRSVPEVVALANRIQKTMTETVPLRMDSFRGLQGEKGITGLITSMDQKTLAAEIAVSVRRDAQKTSLNDIAILVRSGSQVSDLEPELVKLKIPYVIRGTSGFLKTQEVRDVLAYLRVAVNPKDYPAFQRSVSAPKRGIGEVSLEKIRIQAEADYDGNLLEAARAQGKLGLYIHLIETLQGFKDDPVTCLEETIERTNYGDYLAKTYKKDKSKVEFKLLNLERLKEAFKALVSDADLTLDDIVFQLAMNGDTENSEEGRVVVSTIHSSKGLEWSKVYIYGVYEGQLPHKFSLAEREVEEERRLFYVACTRARDHLVLGIPGSVVTSYNTTFVSPSRFLYECGILKR
jgi:DNA helicase-2/ATP-dependent DNA helicase PcrA